MKNEEGPLTAEDIDRGWKEIEVEYKHGVMQRIEMRAPSWREARKIGLEFEQTQDSWTLIRPCLPGEFQSEEWMNKLTPQSIGELHTIAVALLCGNSALKKNQDQVGRVSPSAPPDATTTMKAS